MDCFSARCAPCARRSTAGAISASRLRRLRHSCRYIFPPPLTPRADVPPRGLNWQIAGNRPWPHSLRPSPDDYLFSARGTLLMCPRPFGRGRLRPAGLIMPRARPCGRARLCSAPTTLRARATLFRAHDPAGAGDSGPWCGAWCAASASDLRHASIIFPRAYAARRSAGASGARQVRWAGAHRTSRCRPQSRTP